MMRNIGEGGMDMDEWGGMDAALAHDRAVTLMNVLAPKMKIQKKIPNLLIICFVCSQNYIKYIAYRIK
jgi:hypothetical protein